MMQWEREAWPWFRVAILIWASGWMLAVPLFHIHPEADHRHGEAGHIHGGTVHTAWSQDLDCEFDGHQHGEETRKSTQGNRASIVPSPHLGDGHSELGFSVLNDSTDRKTLKPFLVQVLEFAQAIVSDVERSVWIQWDTASARFSATCIPTRSPRAPPSLFV